MPSFTYITPTTGFARGMAFTAFGDSSQYLALGEYYPNAFLYEYDGITLTPFNIAFSSIFGSWVYIVLNGQLPTSQPSGGIQFVTGGTGGVQWSPISFSGGVALELQIINGGMFAYNSAIGASYVVTGTETFTAYINVQDKTPNQIQIEFFEPTTGWHAVSFGASLFTPSGTNVGPLSTAIGQWIGLQFTAQDLGIVSGKTITGVSFDVWQSNGLSTVIFSDVSSDAIIPAAVSKGYIDAVSDGASGFYILESVGNLYHFPTIGSVNSNFPLPTTSVAYTGVTLNTYPYVIGDDGNIYQFNGIFSQIASAPPSTSSPARQLFTDNANLLYTAFPANKSIYSYNIGSNIWTQEDLSSVVDEIDRFYFNQKLFVAGAKLISFTPSVSGINDIVYSIASSQAVLSSLSSNLLDFWNFESGGWSHATSVSGAGSPSDLAITADGTQILVANSTDNILQVLSYVLGVWLSSNISITNPTSIAITTSGLTQALVTQGTQGTVSIYTFSGGVWNLDQTLSVPNNPTVVAVTPDASSAAVSVSSGVTFLSNTAGIWAITNTDNSFGTTPNIICSDSLQTHNQYLYVIAPLLLNPSISYLYVYLNGIQIGSLSLSTSAATALVENYQAIVPMNNGDTSVSAFIQGAPWTSETISSFSSVISSGSITNVPSPIDYTNLFLLSNGSTVIEGFNNKSVSVARTSDSVVVSGINGVWDTIDLANRNRIGSITTDPNLNIYCVTDDNSLYSITSGAITSGYPVLISEPSGQQNGTPLGISSLTWYSSGLATASGLYGSIIKIGSL